MKPLLGTNECTHTHTYTQKDYVVDVFLTEELSVQELKNRYLWMSGRTKINVYNSKCYLLKINREKKAR